MKRVEVTAHSTGWSIQCPHCGDYFNISPDGHNPLYEEGECDQCGQKYEVVELDDINI